MKLHRSHLVLGLIMAVAFSGMLGFSFGGSATGWLIALASGSFLAASLTCLLFAEDGY